MCAENEEISKKALDVLSILRTNLQVRLGKFWCGEEQVEGYTFGLVKKMIIEEYADDSQ